VLARSLTRGVDAPFNLGRLRCQTVPVEGVWLGVDFGVVNPQFLAGVALEDFGREFLQGRLLTLSIDGVDFHLESNRVSLRVECPRRRCVPEPRGLLSDTVHIRLVGLGRERLAHQIQHLVDWF